MPSIPCDLDIARAASLKPIADIARAAGIHEDELELYGRHKAKVGLEILDRLNGSPTGKLIAVTAIPPTPLGEGKSVTAIGLGQALASIVRLCHLL